MLKKIGKYYFLKKGSFPVTMNGRIFLGDPFHIGFWHIVNKGGFEPEYFKILDKYLHNESVYCDIGSWIGPTVMYASRLCKKIYAFEPDKIAYPFLLQNISLNKLENVYTHNIAIGSADGIVKLASHGGNLGDSMSSMVNIKNIKESITVPAMKWQTWMIENNPEKIDFIKIDIEGGEVEVIPTMIDYLKSEKPILHLSVHGPYLGENSKKEKLNNLFSGLNFYKNCFDENLQKINIDDILVKSCENSFRSFLFTNNESD